METTNNSKYNSFKVHPWHGIAIGSTDYKKITAFIEMVPGSNVKYEVDKASGYLSVDRPQKFSSQVPCPYGFIPQTYCGKEIAKFCGEKTSRPEMIGDGDPLDICVLTTMTIPHGDLLVTAIPIGGMRMIDGEEADDKIIAVLDKDPVFSKYQEIKDFPADLINQIHHYFLSYKDMPNSEKKKAEITHIYDASEARKVIELSVKDYNQEIR